MRKLLFTVILSSCFSAAMAQLVSPGRTITGAISIPAPKGNMSRSFSAPHACIQDTSRFPIYGTTAYNSITISNGRALGQFYGAPQSITVSGFQFYGFANIPNPVRNVVVRVRCNLYKAGLDSLPSGLPLASDTLDLDTVMGTSIPLARITRSAVFNSPVTLNYPYIIVVECDSSTVSAAVVSNSWTASNGAGRNLGCGSISGKWYRCMSLNIGGVPFNAHLQYYPYVKYNFGTNFSTNYTCFPLTDTMRFTNAAPDNVSGSIFYNYYVYYNLQQYSHRWNYLGFGEVYAVDWKYKYTTKKNYDVRLISTVYQFGAGDQCIDTTIKTIYYKPDKPVLKKVPNYCKGDSAVFELGALEVSTTYKWYKTSSSSTPFHTGTRYVIQNVSSNDTFFIQGQNGSCVSTLLQVNMGVYEYPLISSTKNDSICSGAVANLQAKASAGRLEWFTQSSGGLMVYMGEDLQTGKLSKDTSFYVQANNMGCLNKAGRIIVTAYVSNNFAPNPPTVPGDTTICLLPSRQHSITITNYTDTLRWYNFATGGSYFQKGSTHSFTPATRGTYSYYVESWNGVCGSGRSAVNVIVEHYPALFGLTGDTICKGENAMPFASVPWGQLYWYASKSSGIPDYAGKNPVITGLLATKYYYLKTQEGVCLSGILDSAKLTVNASPVPTSATALSVCFKALGTFEVKIPAGTVEWFDDTSASQPIYTGSKLDVGIVLSNLTYYYQTGDKGCYSPKTPLTLTVKPRPTAGFTYTILWQHRLSVVPISTAGLTNVWHWGDGQTSSGNSQIHPYAQAGNYNVMLVATSTTNACRDTAIVPIAMNHVGVKLVQVPGIGVKPVPVLAGAKMELSEPGMLQEVIFRDLSGREIARPAADGRGFMVPMVSPGYYLLSLRVNGEWGSVKILVGE